jgi:hypothetical protein
VEGGHQAEHSDASADTPRLEEQDRPVERDLDFVRDSLARQELEQRWSRPQAIAHPATPPASASSALSTSSWRTMRARLAPSAARIVISRSRTEARRQQHVRDVDAGDQQQQPDGAEERVEHAAEAAHHPVDHVITSIRKRFG